MTHLKLDGVRVAILAADGFEQDELFQPKLKLIEYGATTTLLSIKNGEIRGAKGDETGDICAVDAEVFGANSNDYDALFLPGGEASVKHLRADEHARKFVEGFVASGKPIAAICHGPLLLIDANAVKGRKLTSAQPLEGELVYAGANWANEAVVTDKGLVTSRNPGDIEPFSTKMIEEFAEGRHASSPSARVSA